MLARLLSRWDLRKETKMQYIFPMTGSCYLGRSVNLRSQVSHSVAVINYL